MTPGKSAARPSLIELLRESYPGLSKRLRTPSVPAAPKVDPPVRQLGVLFVHGIGNQQRGRTLTQFGEPLFACLEKWLRHHSGRAELDQVILRGDPGAPAHAVVRLSYERKLEKSSAKSSGAASGAPAAPEVERAETRWLLAESNWADAFERPGFENVAIWSIQVVPWFILTQFSDQLAEDLRASRFGRALLSFAYLVLTFPLALLIQLLVLVLVPMSLLPPLRPVVAPIQRWVSGVIGDTYVLVNSRFQFQSMVSRVRQDLDWLARRCEAVAVLAHSQGAAVAHEAVRQAREPKVERLITFGSAIARLKALRHVMDHAPGMLVASSLVTLTTLVLAGLYLWSLFAAGGSWFYAVFGIWSLGILLALSAYMMPFTLKEVNERCHAQQDLKLAAPTEWDDYYSTADPVPNGRMLAGNDYIGGNHEVHNEANLFRDHSAYWRNQDQFVAAALKTLLGLTGGPFARDSSLLEWQRKRRATRVRAKVGARLAALGVAALALFQHPFFKNDLAVPPWLQWPLGWLTGFTNWVLALATDAASLVATKLRLVATGFTAPQIPVPIDTLSWPVTCLLLAVLWLGISALIHVWWERIDTEDCYRSRWTWRTPYPSHTWGIALAVVGLAWLGFWVSWIWVNPADVWSQLSTKAKSLDNASGSSSAVWAFVIYQAIEMIRKVVTENRELRRQLERDQRVLADFKLGFDTFRANRLGLPPPPAAVWKPPSLWESVNDFFTRGAERFWDSISALGKRDFSGGFAATVSAITAATALMIVLADIEVRGVMQAALGLVALSFGVLGWVRGTRRATRVVAAFGMVLGVTTMPAATALTLGWSGVAGPGLLALGLVAAGCAWGGAEALRRGWRGLAAGGGTPPESG